MTLVKIGERYWIVIAEARGICLSVVKKKYIAAEPNNPLSINIPWLVPFKAEGCRRSPIKHRIVAIEHRKKSTSITGMFSSGFTKMFASAKHSVDRNIERTPSVRIVRSLLKPVKRIVFLISRRNRSRRRSQILPRKNEIADRSSARQKRSLRQLSVQQECTEKFASSVAQ